MSSTLRRAAVATLILVAASLLATAAAAGERYRIEGKVLRGDTDAPVAGAMVFTLPPTHVACTRSDGTYDLGNLHMKRLDVFIYKRGFELAKAEALFGGTQRKRHIDMLLTPETAANRIAGPSTCRAKRRIVSDSEVWIVGTVLRDGSFRRVRGATVTTTPASGSATTNLFGHYALRVPKPSEPKSYVVRARKGEYRAQAAANVPSQSPYARFIDLALRRRTSLSLWDGPATHRALLGRSHRWSAVVSSLFGSMAEGPRPSP